jgi:mycothiol synthase
MTDRFVELTPYPDLPDGYSVRSPAQTDAPALAALLNAHETALTGSSDMTVTDFLGDWEGIDLERDAIVIVDTDGVPAAYADTSIRADVHYSIYGYVHPSQLGNGLGAYLIAWGEQRAKLGAAAAPEDTRIITRHYINEQDVAAVKLFGARGYAPVRVTFTMAIDMTEAPPPPEWPAGLTVRNFDPSKDRVVAYDAYEDAFADVWGRPPSDFADFQSKLRRPYFNPAHWFLVMDGHQVAGTLFSDAIEGRGWIEIVGVRRPWRGRGVAQAMLRQALGAFWARRVTHVGLSVDAESLTGAPRVYQRTGFAVDQTLILFERELRSGVELARQVAE